MILLSGQTKAIDELIHFHKKNHLFHALFSADQQEDITSLWDLLNLDLISSSSATLPLIDKFIIEVSFCKTQYTLAHLVIICKITAILKRILVQDLLHISPIVSNEISYWEDREASQLSILTYGIEMMPVFIRDSISRGGRLVDNRLEFNDTPRLSGIQDNLKTVFIGLQRRTRNWNFMALLRNQIHFHKSELEKRNVIFAQFLGRLARPTVISSITEPSKIRIQNVFERQFESIEWKCAHDELISMFNSCAESDLKILEDYTNLEYLGGEAVVDLYERIHSVIHALNEGRSHSQISLFRRPNVFQRWWMPLTILGVASVLVCKSSYFTFHDIKRYTHKQTTVLMETCKGFIIEWVWKPFQDILKTIRHKDIKLAILGTESLASDLESLQRMVVDFARDHGTVDEGILESIAAQVRNGDLTSVLSHYETDLRSPLRSAVSGDLIRSVLIQVQKAKVDGELAMSALDKLLRSNELNFAFLAFMPTMMITYLLSGYTYNLLFSKRNDALHPHIAKVLR